MSKKLRRKKEKAEKKRMKKQNSLATTENIEQIIYAGEQGEETSKKPWEIENINEVQALTAEVAMAMKEEQDFFDYVKNYTNGFKDSLQPREILEALGERKKYNKGRLEDFDKHMKLRDLLSRMGMSSSIKEEEILRIAYGSQNYSEVEKKIIYSRLNIINPEKYPDMEEQQK